MIRKKQRSAKQRTALAYKQQAQFGIGQTREEAKRESTYALGIWIQAVREFVFRTRWTCQLCGGRRSAECLGPDEMHEDPPRSATRGKPMSERFNPMVCGRLCNACHRDVTEKRIRVVFHDPALRFMGPVSAVSTL